MISRPPKPRAGMTLMELLVSIALGAVVMLILAQAVRNFRVVDSVQSHLSRATREQQSLSQRLSRHLSASSTEGIHLSSDGQLLAIQLQDRLSAAGALQWSPLMMVLHFLPEQEQLRLKEVHLADLGLETSATSAVVLSEADFQALAAQPGKAQLILEQVQDCDLVLEPSRAFLGITTIRWRPSSVHRERIDLKFQSGFALNVSE